MVEGYSAGRDDGTKTLRPKDKRLVFAQVVSDLRGVYTRILADLLQRFFVVVDDELFKRSDRVDSDVNQSLYFGQMRQMRVGMTPLQQRFRDRIDVEFEAFWSRNSRVDKTLGQAAGQGGGGAEFALLKNEELEEEIAVGSMIQKGNKIFQDQLWGFCRRLEFMIEKEGLEIDEVPLSPARICRAFAEAIRSIDLDLAVKLLIYKLFERVVLGGLGALYGELNACLVKADILPNLPKTQKRYADAAGEGVGGTPLTMARTMPGSDPGDADSTAYMEVFRGMQHLLEEWRAKMGMLPGMFPASPPAGVAAFEPSDVIGALNVLQAPTSPGYAQPARGEGLKLFLASELAKNNPGSDRPLGRQEEDIIDMVGLIFDFILDDTHLPDPVKALIARLQIPVIKVAIIEKSFFGRKNHPVRLLLNSLAQAGIGLDSGEAVDENPVFRKIHDVVNRILDEFDQNVGLFSELLDEFLAFLEKDSHRSKVAEERTRQVTQSREQLQLAKRKIAYEIARRLEGKDVPSRIRSFLFNTWKDVLVLAYLRREKQPRDWENALTVIDKLVWTVLPPKDAQERKAIIQLIPRLLKAVKVGLESVSLDPQLVSAALKEIEHSHLARLSRNAGETASDGVPAFGEDETTAPVKILDPELAQAINDLKNNLPDVDCPNESDLYPGAEGTSGPLSAAPTGSVDGAGWERANAMAVGEWVEFDEGGRQVRGKLSWKSQITSTYVFVSRKGAKIMEISLDDLAQRLANQSARLIDDTNAPLMDRAFGALLEKLNGPLMRFS